MPREKTFYKSVPSGKYFKKVCQFVKTMHTILLPFNVKSINIKNSSIEGSSSKKFVGVTFDSNFTFEKHINKACKKGNQKLHALDRCAK